MKFEEQCVFLLKIQKCQKEILICVENVVVLRKHAKTYVSDSKSPRTTQNGESMNNNCKSYKLRHLSKLAQVYKLA